MMDGEKRIFSDSDQAKVRRLLQSQDGAALIRLLQKDGGKGLARAAEALRRGDTDAAKLALSPLLGGEAGRLIERLGEQL
ncbi:MAG: hypothetical protein IJU06_07095 [Oscillospiraceae bacterium]|nr:hypothetical protein [Oscillospiraceae bacterium]